MYTSEMFILICRDGPLAAIHHHQCWRPYGDLYLVTSVSFRLLRIVVSFAIIPIFLFLCLYKYMKYSIWLFFTILPNDQLENRNAVMILDDNIFILKKHLVKQHFLKFKRDKCFRHTFCNLVTRSPKPFFHIDCRYIRTERVQNIYRNMHLLSNNYIQYRSFKTIKSKLRGPTCLFTHVIYRVKKGTFRI